MLQVAEPGLLQADLSRSINLFLGAGFSTLAKNAADEALPVGDALKQRLVTHFKLEAYSSLDLPALYAVLLADRRDALREFLETSYVVRHYDERYDSLRALNVEFLYTTNIDDLAFHIFDARQNSTARLLHDVYLYGSPREPGAVVKYVPLHGSVRHEDADFLFTAGQMSSAFASDRETWYVFQRELQSRPTFFLGYGMRDAGVLQALHDTSSLNDTNKWILLRKEDPAAEALYRSLGFHVMVGEAADFLAYVMDRSDDAGPEIKIARSRFAGEVPAVGEIAQRPIRNFFLGADPEWSDAYSQQVVRRRVNSAVKNSIFTGRHVAIVGLPLSGKSTILKQVATELSSDRHALYFDRISEPQAEQVIAEHKGQNSRALVFVDNLIDSRESIDKLVTEIGAQLVCAENSLYFDSVNLRSMAGKLDVISCSDIGTQDLQRIIDSIPVEVRRWNPDRIDVIEADTGDLGLFEAFRRHVYDENLTVRFRTKLAEFENRDHQAFDVYIMAAYIASCRTIVSFDMMYMFLSESGKKYNDVYDIVGRIGSFMTEINFSDDPHQDYFSVRSGALARIALRECSSRAFARVYDRFHSAVPTRLVVDYPVFRRYAYDNDFARKAYTRVEDGLRFYERLVKSTDNAYDYQHGAIYLSKMKSFSAAFSWIDTALSKSRGRVYSIRNTHARILFEANIDIARKDSSDQTALEGIRESMEVLQEIIEKDQRRNHHLLRFSDQALQYAELFDDPMALQWLILARDKLTDMVKIAAAPRSRESYNLRKYRNLYSDVEVALAARGVARK